MNDREAGERWLKTERVMTSFSGCEDKRKSVCVCVRNACWESESLCITVFSYADELVLLFTVHKLWCMFIYGNIRLWIKALMSHNSLSGSHVGVCSWAGRLCLWWLYPHKMSIMWFAAAKYQKKDWRKLANTASTPISKRIRLEKYRISPNAEVCPWLMRWHRLQMGKLLHSTSFPIDTSNFIF